MRIWTVLALSVVFGACSPEQEAEARARFEIERERVRQGLEAALERLDHEAQELRGKLEQHRGEANEQWQRALEDVEARKALASEKLQKLAEVGADAWAEVRHGFERAADELQRAADDARTPPAAEEPAQR